MHEFEKTFLNRDKTKISPKFFDIIQEALEKVFGPCTEKLDFGEAEEDEERETNPREFREDEAFAEPVIDEMIAIKKAALEKLIIVRPPLYFLSYTRSLTSPLSLSPGK